MTDVDTGEKTTALTWPYRHFDNEAMPIVATALNEMLVQSFDGAIRVFPATPEAWDACFRLACEDGFLVDAERVDGRTAWVCIKSSRGRPCRIVRPWDDGAVRCVELDCDGGAAEPIALHSVERHEDNVLEFPTVAGRRYLLSRETDALGDWTVEPSAHVRNQAAKKLGNASLGLPRMF